MRTPHALSARSCSRVDAFFTYHMHASRMFHIPTFLASLDLPPNDPRFPAPVLLHAMCAVGSLYTASVPLTQVFPEQVDTPCKFSRLCTRPAGQHLIRFLRTDEMHNGRWRKSHYRPDIYGEQTLPEGFSEQQARFTKQRVEVGLVRGDFASLQCKLCLLSRSLFCSTRY